MFVIFSDMFILLQQRYRSIKPVREETSETGEPVSKKLHRSLASQGLPVQHPPPNLPPHFVPPKHTIPLLLILLALSMTRQCWYRAFRYARSMPSSSPQRINALPTGVKSSSPSCTTLPAPAPPRPPLETFISLSGYSSTNLVPKPFRQQRARVRIRPVLRLPVPLVAIGEDPEADPALKALEAGGKTRVGARAAKGRAVNGEAPSRRGRTCCVSRAAGGGTGQWALSKPHL